MHYTLSDAVSHGHGTERPFLCPVHEDSRPSASLNIIKQVWYCYTCGARGSLTGEDALIEPDWKVLKRWFSEKLEEHRVYPEAWLSRWDAGRVHPYWQDRVGASAARRFRLGFDPERGAGTYPLRGQSGEVLGVVRRRLGEAGPGEEGAPKYKYPRGLDIGRYLFNYTPLGRRAVVLTEGAMDAIALWNLGVDAFAIYGAHLSEAQITLIDRVDPQYVFTCFDNDQAGWGAHREVEEAFKHRLVQRITWPASWGKDIEEIGLAHQQQVVPEQLVQPHLTCIGSNGCQQNSKMRSGSTPTTGGLRIRRTRTA